MPDMRLGISGSERVLPKGVQVDVPVKLKKDIGISKMIDGSERLSFGKTKRTWPLTWSRPLSYDETKGLIDIAALQSVLRFQNGYESSVWFNVYAKAPNYNSVIVQGEEKYLVSMTLEESI